MVKRNTGIAVMMTTVLLMGCVGTIEPPPYVGTGNLVVKSYTMHITAVSELSSLCLDGENKMWGVDDSGKIYSLDMTTWAATAYSGNSYIRDWDLEGIAQQGDYLYIVEERSRKLYRLPKTGGIPPQLVTTVVVTGATDPNKGLEGVDIYGDTVYMVNQTEPCWLVKYSLSTAATSHIVLSGYTNLSDIHYDTGDNTLWIGDSRKKQVKHIDLAGRQIGAPIDVSFVSQAEGLVVDLARMTMWIGDDTTGKVYVITLKYDR